MPNCYEINHYDNLGEFYLEEVEPRIRAGEDVTNELNKEAGGSLTRFCAYFNWKGKKYGVRGDTTLEAMQNGYLRYSEKGDEAFYSDNSKKNCNSFKKSYRNK